MSRSDDRKERDDSTPTPRSILDGFSRILERLGDLAQQGRELRQGGEVGDGSWRGAYDVRVRVGRPGEGGTISAAGTAPGGGDAPEVVPWAASHDYAPARTLREPHVDLFEVGDALQLVVEMPGVTADGVAVHLEGDRLWIEGRSAERHYRKEVALPWAPSPPSVVLRCNHGVVDVTCRRPPRREEGA